MVEGQGTEKKRRKKFSATGRQLRYAQLRKVWKHGKANEENFWREKGPRKDGLVQEL